jgi:hypothetical protein
MLVPGRCRHRRATAATKKRANGRSCAATGNPPITAPAAAPIPVPRSVPAAAATRSSYCRDHRIVLAVERNRIYLQIYPVTSLIYPVTSCGPPYRRQLHLAGRALPEESRHRGLWSSPDLLGFL